MLLSNSASRRSRKSLPRRYCEKLLALAGGFLLLWAVTPAQTMPQPEGSPGLQHRQEFDKNNGEPPPVPPSPPKSSGRSDDFRVRVESNLVVLHATVLDKNSKPTAVKPLELRNALDYRRHEEAIARKEMALAFSQEHEKQKAHLKSKYEH